MTLGRGSFTSPLEMEAAKFSETSVSCRNTRWSHDHGDPYLNVMACTHLDILRETMKIFTQDGRPAGKIRTGYLSNTNLQIYHYTILLDKIKVKLSLCFFNHHAMNAYSEVEV